MKERKKRFVSQPDKKNQNKQTKQNETNGWNDNRYTETNVNLYLYRLKSKREIYQIKCILVRSEELLNFIYLLNGVS